MRRPRTLCLLVTVLAVCITSASFARAADAPKKKQAERRIVTLATCYLVEQLEKSHRIVLEADFHTNQGKLILDPNVCGINDFGDTTICTEIAPREIKVELKAMKLGDPSGQERHIYDVIGKGLANRLFLVVPTKPISAFRFVSKDRGGVVRVITLEVPGGREAPCCGGGDGGRPGPGVQIATGTSKNLSFDEALADAVAKLKYPFPDAMLQYTVVKQGGRVGGIAGFREFSVTIRATLAGAPGKPTEPDERRVITLKSCYLHKTLEFAHQLTLQADMHDFTGKLTLDPNTCALNDFGDPTICTKIAPRTIDVKLLQLRLADPSGQNRKIFKVDGQGLQNQLLLVMPTKKGSAFRFVSVNSRKEVLRVVTLETP